MVLFAALRCAWLRFSQQLETVTAVVGGVAAVVAAGRMFAEERALAVAVVFVLAVEIALDADTVLPVLASAEVVVVASFAAV